MIDRTALMNALPTAFILADGLGWDDDKGYSDPDTIAAVADWLIGALSRPPTDGDLPPSAACGASCQNEAGHPGEHWSPAPAVMRDGTPIVERPFSDVEDIDRFHRAEEKP